MNSPNPGKSAACVDVGNATRMEPVGNPDSTAIPKMLDGTISRLVGRVLARELCTGLKGTYSPDPEIRSCE